MSFDTRDSQTRIKHGILHEYVGAWAGIIATGVRGLAASNQAKGQHFLLPLVYVDGYAGPGRYGRDANDAGSDKPVWGSPIIGMRALEQAAGSFPFPIQVSGVLVEDDRERFVSLIENVDAAGLRTPAVVRDSVSKALPGEITLVHADFRTEIRALRTFLGDRFALCLIDPFGCSVPMEGLKHLLSRPKTDAITLFPFHDIDVRGGSAKKPESEIGSNDRGNITRVTKVFGSDAWVEIVRDAALGAAEREERYAGLYAASLRSIDPDLVVKSIALRFSAMDRIGYHLFLTTTDPDGALRMNAILRTAEFAEHFEVWADLMERMRQREQAAAQESMFSIDEVFTPPPGPERAEADIADVAAEILRCCPAGTYTLKKLRSKVANAPFTEGEIQKALRSLKQQDLVNYTSPLKRKGDTVRIKER